MSRHSTDDARFLELLERWLTGAFTAADERELHALLDGDAFRREAWSGFLALPEAEHAVQLAHIRRRLRGASPTRRRSLLLWMSAAAAVLVLVATAVLFWPQADQTTATALRESDAEAFPLSDTLPDRLAAQDAAEAPAPYRSAPKSTSPPPAAPLGEAAPAIADVAAQDDHYVAAGKQDADTSTASEPAVAYEAAPPARQEEVLRAAPARPAAGPPPADTPVKTVATETGKPAPTASARKKRDSMAAQELAKPAAPIPVAAEPVGGWEKFQTLVRQQARLTEAARANNIRGIVRLEFTVGPDGQPVDMKRLQSLGYGCDEVAERLVRAFEWMPAGARATAEVPFEQ